MGFRTLERAITLFLPILSPGVKEQRLRRQYATLMGLKAQKKTIVFSVMKKIRCFSIELIESDKMQEEPEILR